MARVDHEQARDWARGVLRLVDAPGDLNQGGYAPLPGLPAGGVDEVGDGVKRGDGAGGGHKEQHPPLTPRLHVTEDLVEDYRRREEERDLIIARSIREDITGAEALELTRALLQRGRTAAAKDACGVGERGGAMVKARVEEGLVRAHIVPPRANLWTLVVDTPRAHSNSGMAPKIHFER